MKPSKPEVNSKHAENTQNPFEHRCCEIRATKHYRPRLRLSYNHFSEPWQGPLCRPVSCRDSRLWFGWQRPLIQYCRKLFNGAVLSFLHTSMCVKYSCQTQHLQINYRASALHALL